MTGFTNEGVVDAMRFSLRTLVCVYILFQAWFAFFFLFPYFAFLVACSAPSIAIVFAYNRAQGIASKLAVLSASLVNVVPMGIVLHACCYIAAGFRGAAIRRFDRFWLLSALDHVMFPLVGSTAYCFEINYIFLMDWCVELGIGLQNWR